MTAPLSARSGPSDLLPVLLVTAAGAAALVAGLAGQPVVGILALAVVPVATSWAMRRAIARLTPAPGVLDGWRAFRRELQRSRRAARPMTLVRLPATSTDHGHRGRTVTTRLIRQLRRVDHVWAHGDDVYALLPETAGSAATAAIGRALDRAGYADATVRMATFPDDGLTSSALIEVLRGGARVAGAGLRPVADASAPVLEAPVIAAAAFTDAAVPVTPVLAITAEPTAEPSAVARASRRIARRHADEEAGSEVALA